MSLVVVPGTYWEYLRGNNEISPDGYRRPDDGSISGEETAGTTDSEVRQSLFNHPQSGWNYPNNYTDNSCWGYYADGFFDRCEIENGILVSPENRYIAYIGRLFFNPIAASDHYNASLFFPAAGWIYPEKHPNIPGKELVYQGKDCLYWTATVSEAANSRGSALLFSDNHAEVWRAEMNTGEAIRCVKEE
jgi:hypothetical protein